jgi:oxepin-CoA hydrolase/3-oxo-5,6-dehydrosuberyl-CoA semialdehyde dehydrogenase
MNLLGNYINGQWMNSEADGTPLFNAVTGEAIAVATRQQLDFAHILEYGRQTGGPALRKMTFQQRGEMLKKLALFLTKNKEKYYQISYMTGATRIDSWIDIEGGFGNLFANASLRKNFPNQSYHVEGAPIDLSRGGAFMAQHIMVPKEGVAIHINAFNFPVWGMLEKCAVNWMAGVPAVVKPATSTAYLTEAVVRDIIASGILPEGSLQLICGPARNMLDFVESQDVVTFTGSANTGRMLKANKRVLDESVPFNMEADSLNSSVLGLSAKPGTPEFDLFIKEVKKEMTVKCGQKCTAIRRIMVPENYVEDVQIALGKELAKTVIGDPSLKEVRMGSLVSKDQVTEVRDRVKELARTAEMVYGNLDTVDVLGADSVKGAFLSPILLLEKDPFKNRAVHEVEAFGPVSTIIPYKTTEEAVELVKLGKGSLCCSIVSFDDAECKSFVVGAASHHGRILVLNRENAKLSTGHGSPLPTLVHGGPGRAGGGEEMGGMRGVMHYMQRCAVQSTPTTMTQITGIYQAGSRYEETEKHPFQYHFEDIRPGMSLKTHKRTVTDSDIINFANLTWDHFYAHTDITSLEGSIFEKRAAHGYFILAAAAGLFVYPNKGPVAANYGLEECRFVRPVYHNDTLYVRLTCKEKVERDSKGKEFPSGVVKWFVEVFDQNDELVAVATILTLVQKKSPFFPFEKAAVMGALGRLNPDTQAKWGMMTPQHMVEHLVFHFRTAMGQIQMDIVTPEDRIEKWQDSLWNYIAMPENYKHPKMDPEKLMPLEFNSLPEAMMALSTTWDEYLAYFKANPEARNNNAVFGSLDKVQWDLLGRKHFHHHLRQFGLV